MNPLEKTDQKLISEAREKAWSDFAATYLDKLPYPPNETARDFLKFIFFTAYTDGAQLIATFIAGIVIHEQMQSLLGNEKKDDEIPVKNDGHITLPRPPRPDKPSTKSTNPDVDIIMEYLKNLNPKMPPENGKK